MKRRIGIVCLVATMAVLLCGCGPFTCASCGREKHGTRHVLEVAEEKYTLCKDCYQDYAEKKEEIGAAVEGGYGDLSAVL